MNSPLDQQKSEIESLERKLSQLRSHRNQAAS